MRCMHLVSNLKKIKIYICASFVFQSPRTMVWILGGVGEGNGETNIGRSKSQGNLQHN